MPLTADTARALRMRSLLLRGEGPGVPAPTGVGAVVQWFGALQGQQHASVLWSLGRRLPGLTQVGVEAALTAGEAVRTWAMRGTLHLLPARDAAWVVELSAPRAEAAARAVRARDGVTPELVARAADVLGGALAGGVRLDRAGCVAALTRAGVDAGGPRAYHLISAAAQRGVLCLGPVVDGDQRFVSLAEWVPDPHRPGREEALALLAERYVRSHGPCSLRDLAGWAGWTLADARAAVAAAGDALETTELDGAEVLVAAGALDALAGAPPPGEDERLDLLSGFDEHLLGYKDRSLLLDPEQFAALVPGGNAVFRWTVVRGGRVVASWSRTPRREGIAVEVSPLPGAGPAGPWWPAFEAALEDYARFTGRPVVATPPAG